MGSTSFMVKMLNEDDMLEIVLEYYQENEFKNCNRSRGVILGTPGKDLRLISIFGKEDDESISLCNLEELDKSVDFNGDHSFLEKNPMFNLSKIQGLQDTV